MTAMLNVTVEEPYSGGWVADMVSATSPDGSFSLDGSVQWASTVLSSRQEGGKFFSRGLAGKGKLSAGLTDRWYLGTLDADSVALDAIKEAGESGASSLGVRIASWQRKSMSLGKALSALVAETGGVWWVDRAGVIQVAQSRTGKAIDPNTVSLARVGSDVDGSVRLNVLSSNILPGDTWLGQVIRHIRWKLGPNSLEAELSFIDLPELTPPVDYLRHYMAKVDSQNADGTINVIADGRFSVSSVIYLAGIPAKVVLNPGDTVTLAWFGGHPTSPYAYGVQQSGSAAAARVGDSIDAGSLIVPTTLTGAGPPAAVITPFQIQYVPPGPDHDIQVALAMTAMTLFAPVEIKLTGLVTSGQTRILL